LLKILAKATSGLVEWAPNQLAPLVAMQAARFGAVVPIVAAFAVVFTIMLVIPLVILAAKGVQWFVDDDVGYETFRARGRLMLAMGIIGAIGALSLWGVFMGRLVEVHVFRAAPELYVLRALLGK